MKLSIQHLSHARKVGLASVVSSVGAVALAALVLPSAAAGALPVLALTVPFVAAGVVETCLEQYNSRD